MKEVFSVSAVGGTFLDSELSDGLPGSAAGVGFFVTTFDLDGEPWVSVCLGMFL